VPADNDSPAKLRRIIDDFNAGAAAQPSREIPQG
jgi:hypothetical protein